MTHDDAQAIIAILHSLDEWCLGVFMASLH